MTLHDYFKNSVRQKTKDLSIRISGFQGDVLLVERLKELGFHQGLEVIVVGYAPFGGPALFRFGNTVLALRQEEAACLLV